MQSNYHLPDSTTYGHGAGRGKSAIWLNIDDPINASPFRPYPLKPIPKPLDRRSATIPSWCAQASTREKTQVHAERDNTMLSGKDLAGHRPRSLPSTCMDDES